MNTTPLWVPLLVAALGVVGTIVGTVAGVMITQRRSDRREDQAWQRERQREREQWAREDQLRTFDQRRDVYVEFYESVRATALFVEEFAAGWTEQRELHDEWLEPAYSKLQKLHLFAAPPVAAAADAAFAACQEWGNGTRHGGNVDYDHHTDKNSYDRAEESLRDAIRVDLNVPSSDGTGDGPPNATP